MRSKKKLLFLSIILLLIAGISIGYARLFGRLDINGDAGIGKNAWIIYFDNIVERDNNVVPTIDAWITDREKTNIEFAVDLEKPGDKYEFNVDIRNDGTIDACIDSLELYGLNELNEKYLVFTFDYLNGMPVSLWDALPAKTYRRAKASVSFKKDIQEEDLPEEAGKTNLQLQIHYTEKGENVCKAPPTAYTLYIDPLDGNYESTQGEEYDASTKLYKKVLEPNDEFTLGNITPPENYSFTGWQAINNDIYTTHLNTTTNTVTMDQNDAYVIATYKLDSIEDPVARIRDKFYPSIQAAFDDAKAGDMIHLLVDTIESPVNNTDTNGEYIVLTLDGHTVQGTLTNNESLRLVNNYVFATDEKYSNKKSYFINEAEFGMVNNGKFALGYNEDVGACAECLELEDASRADSAYQYERRSNPDLHIQITEENRKAVTVEDIALIGNPELGGIGLKQNGEFNFYDGYLEAYIGLDGVFNDKPENYFVFVDHNIEKNCQKVYLITKPDRAIAKSYVSNGGVMFYFNLQDAFNQSMQTGVIIYAIRDFESPYEVKVLEEKKAIFDIAGFDVETGYTLTNYGILDITDSATRKGTFKPSVTLVNEGQLNIQNMKITGTTDRDVILNKGNINIVKSKITGLGGYAIHITAGELLEMDQETYLKANKFAVFCNAEREFTIRGGHVGGIHNTGNLTVEYPTNIDMLTFGDDTYGVYNDSSVAIVRLKNISLDITNNGPNTYAVYNNNVDSQLVVDGGNYIIESTYSNKSDSTMLESKNGANFSYGGIVRIKDGNIKTINKFGDSKVIFDAKKAIIEGGTIISEGKNTSIISRSNVEISGGELRSLGKNDSYIVYTWSPSGYDTVINAPAKLYTNNICIMMYQGNTTVNGGIIECENHFLEGSDYRWEGWGGAIIINGLDFGTLNINGGDITSGNHGVYGRGTIRMTDGTLIAGKSDMISNPEKVREYQNGLELYPFGESQSVVTMTGGTIESLQNYAIHGSNSKAVITIGGGTDSNSPTLIGKTTAIYNERSGLTFLDGLAIGKEQYGVYVAGPTVIGKQDWNVSITEPEIRGDMYGVYIKNSVDVDMYDGVLKGKVKGYNGVITGTEDATQLYEEDTQIIDEELYHLVYLIEEEPFVRVGDVKFNTLQKAIDYIETEGTIVVLKSKAIRFGTNLPEGKTITLDFDGYTIDLTKPLTNSGSLTLMSSIENVDTGFVSTISSPLINNNVMVIKNGNYSTIQGMLIQNRNSLTIDGGMLSNISELSDNLYGIYNDSTNKNYNPTVRFNGGKLEVSGNGTNVFGIYSKQISKYEEVNYNVTITGGTIETHSVSQAYKDLKYNAGAMTVYGGGLIVSGGTLIAENPEGNSQTMADIKSIRIEDGNFSSNGYVADIIDLSSAIVNGGTFTSNDRCVYMKKEYTLTINGGIFTCGTDLVYGGDYERNSNSFDTVTMTGGTATTGRYGVYGYGTINMTGGSITSEENTFHLFMEKLDSEVTMNGGSLVSRKDKGIYSYSKKTNINIGLEHAGSYIQGYTTGIYFNGGIMNINEADIIGDTKYGVYTNGTTTFGVDEENISITQPMVRGFEYGVVIEEKTTTNINDGIYKGTKYGYKGFISGFPDTITITEGTETINNINYITNYLIAQAEFLRVDDQYFNSLQSAIDYITDTNTIYVIADHSVKTETVVPANKNITIEFDGHTLVSSKTIINNGKLTLEDNGTNPNKKGGIAATTLNPISKLIDNKNELIINGGNYHGLKEIVINNEGSMEFNNGVIYNNAESEYVYGVYNKVVSASNIAGFTMTGGSIEVVGTGSSFVYGIYNELLEVQSTGSTPREEFYVESTISGGEITVTSDFGYLNFDDDPYSYQQNVDVLENEYGAIGIYGGKNIISNVVITTNNDYSSSRGIMESPETIMNSGTIIANGYVTANVVGTNFTMNHGSLESNGENFAAGIYDYKLGKKEININNDSTITSEQICIDANEDTVNITGGVLTCGTNGVSAKVSNTKAHEYQFYYNYGTVNMSGGEIYASEYGLIGYGNLNMSNGSIESVLTGDWIYKGNLDMTGGTISSSEAYGIYSDDAENVLHIGANSETPITANPYVYGLTNGLYLQDGSLYLGYKDGSVHTDNFTIVGGPYGVYNPNLGYIYFYDGTLKGYDYGYYGLITEIEAGTYIYEDHDIINGLQYIANYLIMDIPIAVNTRTLVEYSDLQLAFEESLPNDTIKLIDNPQLYYEVVIPSYVDANFDMAGYNLVTTRTITNNGNIVMFNSNNSKQSYAKTSLGVNLIKNKGTLDITGITFTNPTDRNTSVILNDTDGELTLNNLTINSVNNIENKGELISNNCEYISKSVAILDKGKITINGGTITSDEYGIFSNSNKNGTVDDVDITAKTAPLYKNGGSSTLSVSNSNINVGYVYNSSGTLNIDNSYIYNYIYNSAIMNVSNSEININCVTHTMTGFDFQSVINSGTLTFDNNVYTALSFNNGNYTIVENSGTFNSIDTSYVVDRTYGSLVCWGWTPTICRYDLYVYGINGNGNINTEGSTFTIKDKTDEANTINHMYGINLYGNGKLTTDGDSILIDKGKDAYGIYSVTTNQENTMRDTNIHVSNHAIHYDMYLENGKYVTSGNKFTNEGAVNAFGLYAKTGSFTFETGEVNVVADDTVYGIYSDDFTADVTLGIKDGDGTENPNVHTDYPFVQAIGGRTGIGVKKENGFFRFFDGLIVGNTAAKPDTTSEVELYYEATNFYDDTTDLIFCRLEYMVQYATSLEDYIVVVNHTYYKTLNAAFRKALNGETVRLIREVTQDGVNNNPGSITLDLNGHSINGTVTNNGTMTLIGGQINGLNNGLGEDEPAVINTGTLYIGVNDNDIVYDEVVLLSDGVALINSGDVIMYDGTIRGHTALEGRTIIPPYYAIVKTEITGEYENIYLEPSSVTVGTVYEYPYIGKEDVFVAPVNGHYQLQAWGAQGGSYDDTYVGGYGAYSKGIIYLNAGDVLYINVGGQGKLANNETIEGGYNGGGSADSHSTDIYAGSGGGATSITTTTGLLANFYHKHENIIMVAAGGGGAYYSGIASMTGGSAGGVTGGLPAASICSNGGAGTVGVAASQTAGGTSSACANLRPYDEEPSAFGLGMNGTNNQAGGGAGFFGGGSGYEHSANGGSSYIGNEQLVVRNTVTGAMYGYNVSESREDGTRTISTTNVNEIPTGGYVKSGNGYVKITILDSSKDLDTHQVVINPTNGLYEGSRDPKIYFLKNGDTMTIGQFQNDKFFMFKDVQVNVIGAYDEATRTITMGDEDIIVTANWTVDTSVVKAMVDGDYYVTLQQAINAAKMNSTVYLLGDVTENIVNNSGSYLKIDLGGNKVTGSFANNGVVDIYNGVIENNDGIAFVNNGTLTLGINDKNVEVDSVSIVGKEVGLKQNGIFNYYDGTLEGVVAIDGLFSSIPKGYLAFTDRNYVKNCQKIYLMLIPDSDQPDNAVAKVSYNDMDMYYYNLQDAILFASNGGLTVDAIRNFSAPYAITVPSDTTVLFDIKGYNVNIGSDIDNNGTFTILDSSIKSGVLTLDSSINNNSELTISNILVNSSTNVETIINEGKINIVNSTLDNPSGVVIKNKAKSTIVADSNSYINSSNHSIVNTASIDSGGLTLIGGNYNAIRNDGLLTVKAGTKIKSEKAAFNVYGIYNVGVNAKLVMDGGSIEVKNTSSSGNSYNHDNAIAIFNSDGSNNTNLSNMPTVIINDASIKATSVEGYYSYAYAVDLGKVTIKGGTFEVNAKNDDSAAFDTYYYGTFIFENNPVVTSNKTCIKGNATINGGTYNCEKYGFRPYYNTPFIMRGGTITAKDTAIYLDDLRTGDIISGGTIISTEAYGIYMRGSYSSGSDYLEISSESLNNGEHTYIEGATYGIYAKSQGILTVYDAEIKGKNGDGIYTEIKTYLGFDDSEYSAYPKITGSNNGVYSKFDSIIYDGTLIGQTNYGLYIEGTLNLGRNDSSINANYPIVIGDTYGLYVNSGTLNFYDGIMKGKTNAYYGDISGTADGYDVSLGSEEISGDTYETAFLKATPMFVKVGDTEYNSLQKAVNSITTVGTMEIIANATIKSSTTIPETKEIILDFAGFDVNINKQIVNNGKLTIKDSSEEKTSDINFIIADCFKNNNEMIVLSGNYTGFNRFIYNNKNLTISGGNISVTSDGAETIGIVNNGNQAVFTMENGTIVATNTSTASGGYYNRHEAFGIYNRYGDNNYVGNRPTGTINGGTITATSLGQSYDNAYGVYLGDFVINGGTYNINGHDEDTTVFEGNSSSLLEINNNPIVNSNRNCVRGNVTINGGTYTCERYGYEYKYDSSFEMNGGTITATQDALRLYNVYKNILISGGNIKSTGGYGIYYVADSSYSNSILEINSESLTNAHTKIEGATTGIFTGNYGIIKVEDAEIIGENGDGIRSSLRVYLGKEDDSYSEYPKVTGSNYGIYNQSQLTIYDGTVTGETKDAVYSTSSVTLGTDDGTVSGSYPVLIGEEIGLNIYSGTANFYDGILKGKDNGLDGFIAGLPDGYTVKTGTATIGSELYNTAYLDQYDDFLQVGTQTFNSLQKAIDAVNGTGTIEVIASADVKSEANIVGGKVITLDLAGYTLNMSKQLTNSGVLTIKDTSLANSGGISYSIDNCIVNNNVLTITNGTYVGYSTFIYNNKELTMQNGTITISSAKVDVYGIINNGKDANFVMDNGTIDVTNTSTNSAGYWNRVSTYGIYNRYGDNGSVNNRPTLTINNGRVVTTTSMLSYHQAYNIYRGDVTINGGTFELNSIYEESTVFEGNDDSILTVNNNPTINSDMNCIRGTATINGGTYTCGRYGYEYKYNSTLLMTGGSITATDVAVQFNSAWYNDQTITGGSIISTGSYGIYFRANDDKILTINSDSMSSGYTHVEGATTGVYIYSGIGNIGNAEIIGNTNYGIQTDGTLNIGTKGSGINIDSPLIIGANYGLFISKGTTSFYDGMLKGVTGGYSGSITNIEENSYIFEDTQEINGVNYNVAYIKAQTDIVTNMSTNVSYNNLQTAINKAVNGDTLKLIDNANIFYTVTVPSDLNITLNTDGKYILTSKTITNNGTLKIIDNSGDNTTYIKTNVWTNLLINNGNLTLENLEVNYTPTTSSYYPILNNSGELTLNNVELNSNYYGIRNAEGAILNVNDSEFTTGNASLYDYGEIHLDNVTMSATQYAIYASTSMDGDIKDSTFNSTVNYSIYNVLGSSLLTITDTDIERGSLYNYGNISYTGGNINDFIYNNSGATLTLDSIDIETTYSLTSVYRAIENKGTFNISNSSINMSRLNNYNSNYGWYNQAIYSSEGTVTSTGNTYSINDLSTGNTRYNRLYPLYNDGTSKIVSTNDTINTNKGYQAIGIFNASSNITNEISSLKTDIKDANESMGIYLDNGAATIDGNNDVKVHSTGNSYGIAIYAGKATILDGSFVATGRNGYGLYINTVNAEATMGVYDGSGQVTADVETDYPFMLGIGTEIGNGVRKLNGKFKFFDGKVAGTTDSKPDSVNESEPNYEVVAYYDFANGYEYSILEYMKADRTNIAATIGEESYTSLQLAVRKAQAEDTILVYKDLSEDIVIPIGKKVIIDLNEYTLTGTIVNNANLTLKNGTVTSTSTTITNNGTLNLGINDGSMVYNNIIIIGNEAAIVNNATFNMYDGCLIANKPLFGSMTSAEVGYTFEVSNYNGVKKLSLVPGILSDEYDLVEGESISYIYTGTERTFKAPDDGYYKLDVWGASGGGTNPGMGAYSTGVVYLEKGQIIYINVGGHAESYDGGYNGGGSGATGGGQIAYGGGGATHISTSSGLLSDLSAKQATVLIVAGGGGGSGNGTGKGGSGGGATGLSGYDTYHGNYSAYNGTESSQTNGGFARNCGSRYGRGTFGQGGNYCDSGYGGAGGGGGLYGGGGSNRQHGGAGGGSGYIGNSLLLSYGSVTKAMYCYECTEVTNESTRTLPSDGYDVSPMENKAKSGDGYARITKLVGIKVVNDFDFPEEETVKEQTYVVPVSGIYKLEAWGAQGGSQTGVVEGNGYSSILQGGYGGYSAGEVYLEKGTILYINVGSQGGDVTGRGVSGAGGYNGGGKGGSAYTSYYVGSGGGGGATHIATVSGQLKDLESYKGNWSDENQTFLSNKILIVAGGGGGASWSGTTPSGGGYKGNDSYNASRNSYSYGGTQESGYQFGVGQNGYTGYDPIASCEGTGGGGGGWYGGQTYNHSGSGYYGDLSGGGGSGYIGNPLLTNKVMYCYDCTPSNSESLKTVSVSTSDSNPVSMVPKEGNGHVRITLLSSVDGPMKSMDSINWYFDSDSLVAGTTTWKNEISGYSDYNISGGVVIDDSSLYITGATNSVLQLEEYDEVTVYLVAKANIRGDLLLTGNGTAASSLMSIAVQNSYPSYTSYVNQTDYLSSVPVSGYNVYTVSYDAVNRISKFYVNGELLYTGANYGVYEPNYWLGNYGTWYKNFSQWYKMVAIANTLHSNDEIIANQTQLMRYYNIM